MAAAAIFASCGGNGSQDGSDTDVRISWDYNTFTEMNSVNVSNADYVEANLCYPRIKRLSDGSLLMSFMDMHYGPNIYVRRSEDDGRTWSEPRNITRQVKQESWRFTLQGPGRGITMSDGTLVFPIQYVDSARVPNAGIMYSKDHGTTWHCHGHAWTNTTEAQAAEVAPGVLMLNMRNNRRTGRVVCITEDLGRSWTVHPSSEKLREPVCMAGLLMVRASENSLGRDILLFSNPDTEQGRNHMTIKASLDGGLTWLPENSLLLDEEEGWGYSCLTMIDEDTVGILYEGSTSQLVFQAVKLADIVQ